MADVTRVTSRQETPVFIPAGGETLFGVLTRPQGPPRDVGVILMYGAGYNMSANLDQYWSRLARRVSSEGFHVLRFDHHGNGDSTGRVTGFDLRRPFSDDLEAAIRWMSAQGVQRYVLVGDCLGARASAVCGSRVAGIEGLFLLNVMVHDGTKDKAEEWARKYRLGHYILRALRWSTVSKLGDPVMRRAYVRVAWAKLKHAAGLSRESRTTAHRDPHGTPETPRASRDFLEPLEATLRRGVEVCFVFGDADEERIGEFESARRGRLGRILDEADSLVEVGTVAGGLADVPDLEAQDAIIERVAEWTAAGFTNV